MSNRGLAPGASGPAPAAGVKRAIPPTDTGGVRQLLLSRPVAALVVLLLVLAAAPLPYVAYVAVAATAGTAAAIAVVFFARRHSAVHPAAWCSIAAGVWLFGVSLAFRTAPMGAPNLDGTPTPADFIALGGLLVLVGAYFQVGRWKDDPADSSSLIDAVILTSGVGTVLWVIQVQPVLQGERVSISAVAYGFIISGCSVCFAFSAVRLFLISREKTVAGRRLLLACTLGVLALATSLDATEYLSPLSAAFGTVCFVTIAWAASHPSMAILAARGAQAADAGLRVSLSRWRFAAMTASSLVAPILLLVQILLDDVSTFIGACLVSAWAVVAVLLAVRVSTLVKTREAVAGIERRLADSLTFQTTASDPSVAYERAAEAVAEVLQLDVATSSVAVLVAEGERCTVQAFRGALPPPLVPIAPPAAWLTPDDDGRADDALVAALWGADHAAHERHYLTPLSAHGTVRGALLVSCVHRLTPADHMALRSLAAGLVATMDAFALAAVESQRRSEQHFRALVEHSSDVILVVDDSGRTRFSSPAADRFLGSGKGVNALQSMLSREDRSAFEEMIRRVDDPDFPKVREFRVESGSGQHWLEIFFADHGGEDFIQGTVINARDISERKMLEEGLRHRTLHDDLTGIPNRAYFREELERVLAASAARQQTAAVLFIDVDDFKRINDTEGHSAGDELLKVLALRLSGQVRDGDMAARLGGDEFALVLADVGSRQEAVRTAKRVLHSLAQPVRLGDTSSAVSASIGVAMTAPGASAENLLRHADLAMYEAKRAGKRRVWVFDAEDLGEPDSAAAGRLPRWRPSQRDAMRTYSVRSSSSLAGPVTRHVVRQCASPVRSYSPS